jgi:hypothetical protein
MPDNFEERLAEEARRQEEPVPDLKTLRERVVQEYSRASRKVLLYNGVAHCVLGFLHCLFLGQFMGGGGLGGKIQYATLAIITCLGLVLMKLWYWIVAAKLEILQELKLMRLQKEGEPLANPIFGSYIASLQARDPSLPLKGRLVLIACALAGFLVAWLI